jgi:hypothetical protein
MPLACVLPRIDLQRHFLPRLRPVANDGSFFEKRHRRRVPDSPVRWRGSAVTRQPAELGLTSGLRRVSNGLLRPVVTGDPRGKAAEHGDRDVEDQGQRVDRQGPVRGATHGTAAQPALLSYPP